MKCRTRSSTISRRLSSSQCTSTYCRNWKQRQTTAEEVSTAGWMEQSVYLALELYFDGPDAQAGTGVAAVLEAETVVEGVEIESESLETVEADTEVEIVEAQVETCVAGILEIAVGEADVVEEHPETVAADATLNLGTAVEEGDVIGEPNHETVESECHLQAETAEDMVEEEDDYIEEEHDVIVLEPLESDCNLQAEAGVSMEEFNYEPLPESDSDLEAAGEPDAPAIGQPAVVSIEMTIFKAQEPVDSCLEPEEPEDLSDKQSDSDQKSCEESESDVSDESEWDSDATEEMTIQDSEDSSDASDPSEEEEDDVVVSYLNSSTRVRRTAWSNFLVPPSASRVPWGMWAKLPVTDATTITFEPDHSSLWPSFEFLGCRPMLLLQECGNAMMNVIESLLCELFRIRNDLRRVLGALFRKTETTKHPA